MQRHHTRKENIQEINEWLRRTVSEQDVILDLFFAGKTQEARSLYNLYITDNKEKYD
jgi:hypothetical protein